MSVPTLTHLQFVVLDSLLTADRCGRDLRKSLAKEGHRKSRPAFYQFMARLEEAGYVSGRYVPKVIDGTACRERWYRLLKRGRTAHDATCAFYADRLTANGL